MKPRQDVLSKLSVSFGAGGRGNRIWTNGLGVTVFYNGVASRNVTEVLRMEDKQIENNIGQVKTALQRDVPINHFAVILPALTRLITLANRDPLVFSDPDASHKAVGFFNAFSASARAERIRSISNARQALDELKQDQMSKGRTYFTGEVEELMQEILPKTPADVKTLDALRMRLNTMHVVRYVLEKKNNGAFFLNRVNLINIQRQLKPSGGDKAVLQAV